MNDEPKELPGCDPPVAEPGPPPRRAKTTPEQLAALNERLRRAAQQEDGEVIGLLLSKLRRIEHGVEAALEGAGYAAGIGSENAREIRALKALVNEIRDDVKALLGRGG